jgi:hypothetical protein
MPGVSCQQETPGISLGDRRVSSFVDIGHTWLTELLVRAFESQAEVGSHVERIVEQLPKLAELSPRRWTPRKLDSTMIPAMAACACLRVSGEADEVQEISVLDCRASTCRDRHLVSLIILDPLQTGPWVGYGDA